MAGVVRFLGFNPIQAGSTIAERLVNFRKVTDHRLTEIVGNDADHRISPKDKNKKGVDDRTR